MSGVVYTFFLAPWFSPKKGGNASKGNVYFRTKQIGDVLGSRSFTE